MNRLPITIMIASFFLGIGIVSGLAQGSAGSVPVSYGSVWSANHTPSRVFAEPRSTADHARATGTDARNTEPSATPARGG
jgi:hypothetical protein